MTSYRVLAVQFEPAHREEIREISASCYAEAFGMAERADAGVADFSYGVPADCYELARAEGIPFNEADGLLVDDDPRQAAERVRALGSDRQLSHRELDAMNAWPGHVYGSNLTPAERRKADRDEHRARNGRRR